VQVELLDLVDGGRHQAEHVLQQAHRPHPAPEQHWT
jgi:hypothetical protein